MFVYACIQGVRGFLKRLLRPFDVFPNSRNSLYTLRWHRGRKKIERLRVCRTVSKQKTASAPTRSAVNFRRHRRVTQRACRVKIWYCNRDVVSGDYRFSENSRLWRTIKISRAFVRFCYAIEVTPTKRGSWLWLSDEKNKKEEKSSCNLVGKAFAIFDTFVFIVAHPCRTTQLKIPDPLLRVPKCCFNTVHESMPFPLWQPLSRVGIYIYMSIPTKSIHCAIVPRAPNYYRSQ